MCDNHFPKNISSIKQLENVEWKGYKLIKILVYKKKLKFWYPILIKVL